MEYLKPKQTDPVIADTTVLSNGCSANVSNIHPISRQDIIETQNASGENNVLFTLLQQGVTHIYEASTTPWCQCQNTASFPFFKLHIPCMHTQAKHHNSLPLQTDIFTKHKRILVNITYLKIDTYQIQQHMQNTNIPWVAPCIYNNMHFVNKCNVTTVNILKLKTHQQNTQGAMMRNVHRPRTKANLKGKM